MIDITVIGGGSTVRTCTDVLSGAGFNIRRSFELDDQDRSPILLGELPSAYSVARQVIAAGRHLLITNPEAFAPDRLALLYEERRKAQSLFLWSERRFHPSHHFISGLIETDSTWQPRYVRQETLLTEPASNLLTRWTLLESMALVTKFSGEAPTSVSTAGTEHPQFTAMEHVSVAMGFKQMQGFIIVSSGEAIERRETLIAASNRKAFIDELNPSVPVRLVTDSSKPDSHLSARWLSCPPPIREELARQQCLAFLDATLKANLAQEEANLWTRALSTLVASDESLRAGGHETQVQLMNSEGPRFRILSGSLTAFPGGSIA